MKKKINNSYRGGKGAMGVHQYIISKMPKHETYIETHLGSGKILLKKKLANSSIGIDLDASAISNFKEYSVGKFDDARSIELKNIDAFKFLIDYDFKGNELVYLDPPYPFETRIHKKDIYKHEYTNEQHEELVKLLANRVGLDCFVMISSYSNRLYDRVLLGSKFKKWYKFTFNAMTRKGVREEALYCNFNPDEHIKHDYSYIGKDYRDRERIKRKGERWIKNLDELGADERNYILSKILNTFSKEVTGHF